MVRTAARTEVQAAAPPDLLAYIEMLLVTLIWGGGAVSMKIATEGFTPLSAAMLRTGLASLGYLPLLLITSRGPTPARSDLPRFLLLALFGFVLFNVFYYIGIERSTATHASLIFGASPVATAALAALFLRERVSSMVVAGVVISTAGVGMVVLSSAGPEAAQGATLLGDLLLVGETLSWVGFSLVAPAVMRRFSPLRTTAYACILGFLLLLPVAVVAGFRPDDLVGVPARPWLALLYSGLVSVVVAYVLWNRALLRLGPTRTAVFSNLTPLWGVLLARLIEGEAITLLHAVAIVTILGGVLIAGRARR